MPSMPWVRSFRSSPRRWPGLCLFALLILPLVIGPNLRAATAEASFVQLTPRLEWPVRGPFLIGAQFHDFQNYSNVPYLHGGIDLRAPAGTVIFTPVAGPVTVSSYQIDAGRSPLRFQYRRWPFNPRSGGDTRYVEVAVTDAWGNTWMFRHLDAASIPGEVLRRSRTGEPVATGTPLGTIVAWHQPVLPEPATYHHCHLEVVASDGTYLNPALFLAPLFDNLPPQVHGAWLVRNEEERAFPPGPEGRPVVDGDIDLVAAITDEMPGSRYQHSPFRVRTRLLAIPPASEPRELLPWLEVLRFDRLPVIGDRTQLATVIYKERVRAGEQVIASNGEMGPRSFLLTLTNGDRQRGYAARYALPTRALRDGRYRYEIEAADLAGNVASAALEFEVRNR